MRRYHRILCVLALGGAAAGMMPAAHAQTAGGYAADWVNVREDLRLLNQRVGELALRVEQLERENAALQRKAAANGAQAYATVAQLNEAVLELNRAVKGAIATAKDETLRHVATQIEKLANQTNTAIESLAKAQGSRAVAVAAAAPSKDPATSAPEASYPKEGISYIVQKGDTLAKIAQKTGAKQQDIIAANRLSDPSKIQVGQALFIPGGK